MDKTLSDAVAVLDNQVPNPSKGLPDELFLYVSRVTPFVNVDLLIKDEDGRTLLSWRDDKYAGKGWYLSGGIVRFRETFETRIIKTALREIGCKVRFNKTPIAINQVIYPEHRDRSHFISLLYECFLSKNYELPNKGLSSTDAGFLKWHNKCPSNMIICHRIYRKYIENNGRLF